jgi:UDP-glucose 4-epimerase
MKILVTGGAGFIGSNLSRKLSDNAYFPVEEIVVIDNLSLGKKEFIQELIDNERFFFYEEDLLNFDKLLKIFEKHNFDLVWHLSANSDIGYGSKFTDWDLKQGTLVTYNVLECMKRTNVKKIIFASTSAIYGEATTLPTPENYGPLHPISFYGASKLACEALITAFCHNFEFQAWIYRFGNIVGKNGTHGAIFDFMKKLKKDSNELEVLGNGKQAKPYLYVEDCVNGMAYGFKNSSKQVNFFNLACEGATSVSKIAESVIKIVNPAAIIKYTGGERGWVGDVAQVRLDTKKMERIDWEATYSSDEAVKKAIEDLVKEI